MNDSHVTVAAEGVQSILIQVDATGFLLVLFASVDRP